MSPLLISAVLGLALTVMTLNQVAPSVISIITSKSVESGVNRGEALIQQIIQYRTNEGVYPANIADLVAKNYWRSSDNNNGFGGIYSFTVDDAKGLVFLSTTISDADKRTQYLANYRHVFKPVDSGSGVILTTFVMPSTNANSVPLPPGDSIPVSAVAPSAATNTYWYDTSGAKAVLKVSNGTAWMAVGTGPSGIKETSIVTSANDLPVTATVGDIRYVFNAVTNTLDTVVYYNGAWTNASIATPRMYNDVPVSTSLAPKTLPIGTVNSLFGFDFKSALSSLYTGTLISTLNASWSAVGTLPAGLALNPTTGVLTGTPTEKTTPTGTFFDVVATYNGTTVQQTYNIKVAPPLLSNIRKIYKNSSSTCALLNSGSLKCWGSNSQGQIGDGTFIAKSVPTQVTGLTSGVVDVAMGTFHTCALLDTGAVKCWGYNSSGQVGDGSTLKKSVPTQVVGLTSGVVKIFSNYMTDCALLNTGALQCWGANGSGQLGDGTLVNKSMPVQVIGLASGVKDFVMKSTFAASCALLDTGAVKCWGDNSSGAVGDGTTVNISTPTFVAGLPASVKQIVSNGSTNCVLFNAPMEGQAACWGNNSYGVFGNGTGVSSNNPPVLMTGVPTADISALFMDNGASGIPGQSCVVLLDFSVKCFGYNAYGQTGNGSNADLFVANPTPVSVILLIDKVSKIQINKNANCALLLTSGSVKCWGLNSGGELGDGTLIDKYIPTQAIGLDAGVVDISNGSSGFCVVLSSGKGKCWGSNSQGQIGDGTVIANPIPVDIITEVW